MYELLVVGAGPGDPNLLTPAARLAIDSACTVVAAHRHAKLVPPEKLLQLGKLEITLNEIERRLQGGNVAVLVSGDPGFYSLLPRLKRRFPKQPVRVIPGIGSLSAFFAELGETWQGATILSAHGRALKGGTLAAAVKQHQLTCLFCDQEHNPAWVLDVLIDWGFSDVHVAIGERVSYPDQRLSFGTPRELAGRDFDGLSVVRIVNPRAKTLALSPGVTDDQFIRESTPMTKEEVRWLILCKLNLEPSAIVWDVGSGTGSVAIECARLCPYGQIYAIEEEAKAIRLIKENRERFGVSNLSLQPGVAPHVLGKLPTPTHVFVGGSGGRLKEILHHVQLRGGGITILVSSVTLMTAAEAVGVFQSLEFTDLDVVQLAVCRGKAVGDQHIMKAQNPVTLVRAITRGDK